MSIGERIYQIRKSLEMSQADFGKALGVCTQTVSRWERDFTPISKSIGNLICARFYVNDDWLWYNKGNMLKVEREALLLLEQYRALKPNAQKFLSITAEALLKNQKEFE